MEQKYQEIARKLTECIQACNHCHDACLSEENVKEMAECIRLDKDCAVVCSATLNLLHQNSRFVREALMFCKNVCITCKLECKKFPADHCQKCYEACKACAIACDEILSSDSSDGCGCEPVCECGDDCGC